MTISAFECNILFIKSMVVIVYFFVLVLVVFDFPLSVPAVLNPAAGLTSVITA